MLTPLSSRYYLCFAPLYTLICDATLLALDAIITRRLLPLLLMLIDSAIITILPLTPCRRFRCYCHFAAMLAADYYDTPPRLQLCRTHALPPPLLLLMPRRHILQINMQCTPHTFSLRLLRLFLRF